MVFSFSNCTNLFFLLIIICCCLDAGVARDIITSSQSIKDPETISSNNGNFTFGFFSPENSTNHYVGIWWNTKSTVIWVANRDQPLNDSSGIVRVSEDGNLVVLDGQKRVIWSSNVPTNASNAVFRLQDNGNLVLQDTTTRNSIWESFQHPSDALLAGMKLKSNKRTGEKMKLTSWKSPSNPSIGSFSFSVEHLSIPEMFIWNETRPYWRSGLWNSRLFTGIPTMKTHYLSGIVDDGQGNVYLSFSEKDVVGSTIFFLNSQGNLQAKHWDEEKKEWGVTSSNHQVDCDVYGMCGAFASCNSQNTPICSCLRGFEPRNTQEWNRQNWTSGCVRRKPLQCESANNQNTRVEGKEDGFFKLSMIKAPDFSEWSSVTEDTCRNQCLKNCSCIGYSYDPGIGCMSWNRTLIDIEQFSASGLDLYVRVASIELGKHDKERNTRIIITTTVLIGIAMVITCAYIFWKRTYKNQEYTGNKEIGELSMVKLQEVLQFNFQKIATATNNFHASNKLGQGGFGPVYKGKLQDGREIAVKRLSRTSGQGLQEFMNEVVVISKLQHRNLARLLGCCIEGDEKMLIYEYMPNKSLDAFVFDPSKNILLDWRKRFSIIEGIARGLLYLHRDSRLKIIHRDLKASNILLDEELNPKISDFGMARIFGGSENQANTKRIVGTYGYMSPEYAMQGRFSEKSDVFSFGVSLLEIISGKRNSSFCDSEDYLTLLGLVWIQWTEGNILSLLDPGIYDCSLHENIVRCIHIGLLCVQEFAANRPTMAAVVSMLNSEIADLPPPRQPGFILKQNMLSSDEKLPLCSINAVSISDIHGR